MPDEVIINTGYGTLPVPKSLLRIWATGGWPDEAVLKRMTEAGTVEAVAAAPRPRRPTPAVAYMVALNHIRHSKLAEATHIIARMSPAELLAFGDHVDELRALITAHAPI